MNRRHLRIAIYSRHYSEYVWRYAVALSGHAKVLLFLDCRTIKPRFVGNENLTIVSCNFDMRRGGIADQLRVLRRMRDFQPDIAHFQEVPDPITPILTRAASRWAKIVLTVHDPLPHSGRDATLPWITTLMQRLGRASADAFVVHGDTCAAALRGIGDWPATPILSSTHGVLGDPGTKSYDPDGPFLMFGRMEDYKGLDVLAAAIEQLAVNRVDRRIIVAGRGPALNELADTLGRFAFVTVRNRYIPDDEMQQLFDQAACILLPYKDATQSGVVAAAFGAERPVIASNTGGIGDVVINGDNGVLVPPGDADALAKAITELSGDRTRLVALKEGARASANGSLNWNAIILPLLDDFAKLAAAR